MAHLIRSLTFALVLAVASVALQAQSVAGNWVLTINSPQGSMDTDVTFTQDGTAVTGSMSSPMGETEFKGEVNGSTVKVTFGMVTPGGPIDIVMTGEVTGDDMKGTMDVAGFGAIDFTGKRK